MPGTTDQLGANLLHQVLRRLALFARHHVDEDSSLIAALRNRRCRRPTVLLNESTQGNFITMSFSANWCRTMLS